MARNETVFITAIYDDIKQLIRMVNAQTTPASSTILNVLEEYKIKFTDYIAIQEQIGNNPNEELQGIMHLNEMAPLLHEKKHLLSFTRPESLSSAFVDQQSMRQVVLNLISNATKYTPSGGKISVEIETQGSYLRWSIRDSGIGIPQTALSRLFEKFYRAENALTVETEGTGLWPSLVRLILEQFSGRIWCESEEGKGSTFIFVVPLLENHLC